MFPRIAFFVALLSLGLVSLRTAPSPHLKAETAYERVMRTRTLHCGYLLWPVLETLDPNTKRLSGLVPDFTEELGKKLGLKIEWTQEVIMGQEPEMLRTGKIDAVCGPQGPWVYTSATVVDYTEPMLFFPIHLYGREGEKTLSHIDEANSDTMTFSSIEGDISLAMALDRFPKAKRLELPGSADPGLILVNVATRKADFVLTDPLTVNQYNQTNGKKLARIYDPPLAMIDLTFSVGKGEGELLQMLNQGLRLLQQLGISDQILDNYDGQRRLFARPLKRWL